MINAREEKNQRRRRILHRYNLAVLLGYSIPILTMYAARWQNLVSTSYDSIHIGTAYVIVITMIFFLLCVLKKNISDRFTKILYIFQFAAWLFIYFYVIIIIHEIRPIALLWGFIGLVFLLSQAGFRFALTITLMAFLTYLGGAFVAIHFLKQSSVFSSELLFALVFLFVGVFLSYTAGLFKKQRSELKSFQKKLKDEKEKAMEADAALRESEEKYRSMVSGDMISYFEVNLKGNIRFFNDGFAKFIGYSPGEIFGMNYLKLMTEDTAKNIYKMYNSVFKGERESVYGECEIVRRDGKIVYGGNLVSLMRDKTGAVSGFRVLGIDITELKKTEEALRRSEERYRLMVETAPDAICRLDNSGKFVYLNASAVAMIGYSHEEATSLYFWYVIHPDYRKEVIEQSAALQAENGAYQKYEFPVIRKDGNVFWVNQIAIKITDNSGNPEYHVIARDITAKKQAEEEIKAARDIAERANLAKSRFLAGMSHELRTPLNAINGIIELLRFGSYERDEEILPLIENLINEIMYFSVKNQKSEQLNAIASELGKVRDYMADDGNFKRYFFTRVRDELSEMALSGENQSPGKTAEQIAAIVDSEEKEIASAYRRIKESGDYLLALIDDVLNLSKVETGSIEINKTDIDIANMINSIMLDAASYARSRGKEPLIEFRSAMEGPVPRTINCDEQKIRQVLLNFLSNAVKFTQNGTVSLDVSAETKSAAVRFTVTDTGMGISDEEKKLLFVEFGRTSAVNEIDGSGLGLFISKKLVELQGGRIGFESEQGKGSSFWFELPL